MNLYSSIVCENVQILENGDYNYISVFNEIYGLGPIDFHICSNWSGDNSILLEKVELISPSGKLIAETEQEIKLNQLSLSIVEMEVDIEELGEHWIVISESDKVVNKIPLFVLED